MSPHPPPPTTSELEDFLERFNDRLDLNVSPQLHYELIKLASDLWIEEFCPPPQPPDEPFAIARYKDALASWKRRDKTVFEHTLFRAYKSFLPSVPPPAEALFTYTYEMDLLDAQYVSSIFQTCRNPDLFKSFRHQLTKNAQARDPTPATVFLNTPLDRIRTFAVPLDIPLKTFASHGIILAPPNHGKTQLTGTFIKHFLENNVGCVLLDPHGDLFNTLKPRVPPERLVVLDPDTDPPALNFLDFGQSTQAETLQTFSYLMSSLSGGLTDKQGAIVPYLLKLLRRIPDASLETLRLIVDEKVKKVEQSQFVSFIQTLPLVDQGFFHNQFYSTPMQLTKDAIGWKLYAALSSDTFRDMFGATSNSFSADDAMRERKVVLVKGGRRSLGDEGMKVFLQFIVAQFFSAALRRERIPHHDRHLCVLAVDEAHHVFNPQISNILTECRKYGLGFLAATQVVQQIPEDVKAAIYGATAIKIAGPVSHSDAMILAREMYTTGEFIRSMASVERSHAEFAFYVSGVTGKQAVRVKVPYGQLEAMPQFKTATTTKAGAATILPTIPPATVLRTPKPAEPQVTPQSKPEQIRTNTIPFEFDTDR